MIDTETAKMWEPETVELQEAVEPNIMPVDPALFEKKKAEPRGTPLWRELKLHEMAVDEMIQINKEDRTKYTKAKNSMATHTKDGVKPYAGRVFKARKGNDGNWYLVRVV